MTSNPTLTSSWSLLVTAGDEFLLSAPVLHYRIEVAAVDDEGEPDVDGHPLQGGGDSRESLNRALIGPGYIYARSLKGAVDVVVTTWTPA